MDGRQLACTSCIGKICVPGQTPMQGKQMAYYNLCSVWRTARPPSCSHPRQRWTEGGISTSREFLPFSTILSCTCSANGDRRSCTYDKPPCAYADTMHTEKQKGNFSSAQSSQCGPVRVHTSTLDSPQSREHTAAQEQLGHWQQQKLRAKRN